MESSIGTVTIKKQIEVEQKCVVLKLTEDEAKFLHAMHGRFSTRKIEALKEEGSLYTSELNKYTVEQVYKASNDLYNELHKVIFPTHSL